MAIVQSARFQATIASADATSATQVQAKAAGKSIYITSLVLSTDTAMNLKLQDDAASPAVILQSVHLAANGGVALSWPEDWPLKVAENQDLDVIASASGNISVTVVGYQR